MKPAHRFRGVEYEKLHEKISEVADNTLEVIAAKEHQDARFHELRGFRNACEQFKVFLVELDKKEDKE